MATAVAAENFVDFRAAFDGTAVEAGRMSARHFAGAVFAFTELIEQAAAEEFKVENAVAIEIRANFREGSFDFGLLAGVAIPGAQHVIQTLSVADLTALLKHIGLISGLAQKSLLALVKKFGQRPITEIKQEGNNNVALVINVGDHAEIVTGVPSQVAELYNSERVRAALADVVKPLLTPGIDELRIGPREQPVLTVSSAEAVQFEPPRAPESELTDSTAQTALELLSPNFVEGHVWKVSQGGQAFNVRLSDDSFLQKIDQGEAFAKGDYLIVELRTRMFATPKGLRPDREVTKVIVHMRRAEQTNLFQGASGAE